MRTKWTANEYTFGCYSYVGLTGSSDDYLTFETPIEDKLFFAGEHTIKDYRSSVHGAYLSGIRAAN